MRELSAVLADHGQAGWIDSRELRGGDPLWSEIEQAIEAASAYAIVVSTDALQSKWVGKELHYALNLRDKRGKENFPVIPLSLNGTKLGVLEEFFGEEPVYIPVSSDAGGVDAAMNAILVAMRMRLPADVAPMPQPKAEPLEELVLELTDLKFYEQDGVRRASARARLVYEPATQGMPNVVSEASWRFVAPIGPIEAEELQWYLEKYAIWPSHYFADRARKVEKNLVAWGKLLHEEAMPLLHTNNVMKAWEKINDHAGRLFSIHVDASLVHGVPEDEKKQAKEAATLLLGLPWELLHDGKGHLFQGAKPTRVRRRLPNTEHKVVPPVATPIRILLVTARPEDESCGYIDHRVSALPLVEAMESLPGLVKLHVLNPPTLPALREELDCAREHGEAYHVVHFDGHGVYDKTVGLGGLCFEKPEDASKLERRGHFTVYTSELGPLLRDHRIPLVFLEACQTALADKASESVASELLKVGVASVVAMSHSVLVETARRFVEAFYKALANGKRVGDAMLAGQRQLKDDTFRGRIFGAGELRLEDWFVPVLFQEKNDPQLFTTAPAKQTQEDFKTALAARLGNLPPTPDTGFIGRSRELLALQRLLHSEKYAVVRGQGGEGKTALAAEFARWMVRSHQLHRVAFVSVETYTSVAAVLDALGRQLVGKDYSVATFENFEKAIQPVERALREQSTLLVVDNMESILLPPFLAEDAPEALTEDARRELDAILKLCERLNSNADIIFTSREALPALFDAARNQRPLHQLHRDDAVKLVERTLNAAGGEAGASSDAAREEIEQLVDAVHCHARTLALLAPALQKSGVESTRRSLVELMVEMEREFPGSREKSVFASVELSLQRMSAANRERVKVLGVFHGGVNLRVLQLMMGLEEVEVASLATELIETGLATPNSYNHLALNPALCPYQRGRMEKAEIDVLADRWVEVMRDYADFLVWQQNHHPELASTLKLLELPNLFALLGLVQQVGDAEATIDLATSLCSLLEALGKPRLLERVGEVRDAAAASIGNSWNHARFDAMQSRIEQQLAGGQLQEAYDGAQAMLQRARAAGEQAYSGAVYDFIYANYVFAKVLNRGGSAEQALPLLEASLHRYETIMKNHPNKIAENMVAENYGELAQCFDRLQRFDQAAVAYEEGIRRFEALDNKHSVAVLKANLGTTLMSQGSYQEALNAHNKACELFSQLSELTYVAMSWHQIGMVYQEIGQMEAAEDAYRKSLAINVKIGNVAMQAGTLIQLGNLYKNALGHVEQSVLFYQQAADKFAEIGHLADEARARSGLAIAFRLLRRFDESRDQIRFSINCTKSFGHAIEPWKFLVILSDIEKDAGNQTASIDAKRRAIDSYLTYRREGGENHDVGRLSFLVTKYLLAGDSAAATSILMQFVAFPGAIRFLAFSHALQSIVAGSRDLTLADDPDLDYGMAAEILFLIETLEKQGL